MLNTTNKWIVMTDEYWLALRWFRIKPSWWRIINKGNLKGGPVLHFGLMINHQERFFPTSSFMNILLWILCSAQSCRYQYDLYSWRYPIYYWLQASMLKSLEYIQRTFFYLFAISTTSLAAFWGFIHKTVIFWCSIS